MMQQQDVVFHLLFFIDECNILCYHINGLFFMHGLPRSKVFVPDMLFREQHLGEGLLSIGRHQKSKEDFWCLFFVVQKRNVKCAKKQEGRKCKIIHKR